MRSNNRDDNRVGMVAAHTLSFSFRFVSFLFRFRLLFDVVVIVVRGTRFVPSTHGYSASDPCVLLLSCFCCCHPSLLSLLSITIRVGDSLESVRGFPRIRCLSFCAKFGFLKPSLRHISYCCCRTSVVRFESYSPVSSQFQVVWNSLFGFLSFVCDSAFCLFFRRVILKFLLLLSVLNSVLTIG